MTRYLFLFIFCLHVGACADQTSASILYKGKLMAAVCPEYPIGSGTVRIESVVPGQHLSDWTVDQHAESWELIQKIAAYWEANGITDYMVIGKEVYGSQIGFGWNLVPYPQDESSFWKLFLVGQHIIYDNASEINSEDQKLLVQEFERARPYLEESFVQKTYGHVVGTDSFCQPEVIARQQIAYLPDSSVEVLQDYRPLTDYHYLAISKNHVERFSNLPLETYLDAMAMVQKLIVMNGQRSSSLYFLHKTGKRAGQTVPHWHCHVIGVDSEMEVWKGRLKMLINMVWGMPPLSPEELAKRVAKGRMEFAKLN